MCLSILVRILWGAWAFLVVGMWATGVRRRRPCGTESVSKFRFVQKRILVHLILLRNGLEPVPHHEAGTHSRIHRGFQSFIDFRLLRDSAPPRKLPSPACRLLQRRRVSGQHPAELSVGQLHVQPIFADCLDGQNRPHGNLGHDRLIQC